MPVLKSRTWTINEDGFAALIGLDDSAQFQEGLIDLYRTTATQEFPLGTLVYDITTGRRFRYCQMGAVAGVVGNLYQGALPIANHARMAIVGAPAIGATSVTVTPGATTGAADLYKDGFLNVVVTPGVGHTYRVKGHLAISASTDFVVNLYDPLKVALTTTSRVTLAHNKYKNVLIHPSPPTAVLAGVPVVAISASQYGWLSVAGPTGILTQGTLVIGDICVPSATVDGAVMPSAAFSTDGPEVGNVMRVESDTEYSLIDMKLN